MTFFAFSVRTAALVLASLLALAASPAIAQDEPLIFNAFAVVQTNGTIVRSADKQALVQASLSGTFYIETDEGPVEGGKVACSGALRVDLDSTRQTGSGACTSTAADGATTVGEWQCEGFSLIGCRGTYRLTGGTGRLAGFTGEATLIWRPSDHAFRKELDGTVLHDASGILIWRDFKLAKR